MGISFCFLQPGRSIFVFAISTYNGTPLVVPFAAHPKLIA
jgi:hypothetical protein